MDPPFANWVHGALTTAKQHINVHHQSSCHWKRRFDRIKPEPERPPGGVGGKLC
jgi:hypothetical protein